jgi:hypothetical protein
MRDVDGVMPAGVRISKEIIDAAPRLRVVSNIAVGYDNIDIEACNRRHILVTNTAGVLTEATADLAFALLLAAGRRVAEGDRYVRGGNWKQWEWNCLWGTEMHARRWDSTVSAGSPRQPRVVRVASPCALCITLVIKCLPASNMNSLLNLWTVKPCCGNQIFLACMFR